MSPPNPSKRALLVLIRFRILFFLDIIDLLSAWARLSRSSAVEPQPPERDPSGFRLTAADLARFDQPYEFYHRSQTTELINDDARRSRFASWRPIASSSCGCRIVLF
jgi:hypothetical protein